MADHSEQNARPDLRKPQASAGLGLRHAFYRDFIEQRPAIDWLEIHPENYFGGGAHRHFLREIRKNYPISFHGVGLSLGSPEEVSGWHLAQLKELIELFEPFQISDHASWSLSGNAHLNDLLPLPYTEESLAALCRNIDRTQVVLGQTILIENPSTYVSWQADEMPEWEFMNEAARRTGCGILLDVNNIYVQSKNHGLNPYEYVENIDSKRVGEMHLAGHTIQEYPDGQRLLIDTHDARVCQDVWRLYEWALHCRGPVNTLIEWDQNFPELPALIDETYRARNILNATLTKEVRHAAE